MLGGSRKGCSSPWLEWRGALNDGGCFPSERRGGEGSEERESLLLSEGEKTESSGDVMPVDGARDEDDCESLEMAEGNLCFELGGSLPLLLSAPLPLRLVLVVPELGLARCCWPPDNSESLGRFEASLSVPIKTRLLKQRLFQQPLHYHTPPIRTLRRRSVFGFEL